jgi:hypothetical protein
METHDDSSKGGKKQIHSDDEGRLFVPVFFFFI